MDKDRVTKLILLAEERLGGRTESTVIREDESLEATIANLQQQLREREIICNRLESTLERLMSDSRGGGHIGGLTIDLSENHFKDSLSLWKTQVWFKKPIPPLVEMIFEKVASTVTYHYEVGNRRTAFTLAECRQLVEPTREMWESELPPAIAKVLTVDNRVYASAAERSNGAGEVVEAVHYLVYLVHKVYNRAAFALYTLKKKSVSVSQNTDTIGLADAFTTHQALLTQSKESKDSEGDLKWHENPWAMLQRHLVNSRLSVKNAITLRDLPSVERAITLSVTKLVGNNKLKLVEAIPYLASIISLKDHAATKGWTVNGMLTMKRKMTQTPLLMFHR